MTPRRPPIAPEVLARLGEGHLAYIRRMTSDELVRTFPQGPALPPGLTLWALFGAGGQPILVADDPRSVLASAQDQDLIAVTLQ